MTSEPAAVASAAPPATVRAGSWTRRGLEALGSLRDATVARAQSVSRLTRPVRAVISPLGWSVLALAGLAWVVGAWLGWQELMLVAATCLVALAIAVVFVLGRATLRIKVELQPPRLVAGERAAGRILCANRTQQRTLPMDVELPVGQALATFRVPSLAPGGESEELFVVPTERRGVISVGPATTVRGDPLGLLLRRVAGGGGTELLVHPKTIPLPSFGAGVLRDLEGLTTKEVSASDLAFHSLRDYAPGDDRRFVHWKSSAKAMATTGRLQVRQFNDTRRSSLSVVVDARTASYPDPEDFEIALQVAGSLVLRAARDGLQALLVAGSQLATSSAPHLLLDALARATLSPRDSALPILAGRAAQRGTDTTLAVILSGSAVPAPEMRRAALRFPSEVRTVAIRIVPGERWVVGAAGLTTLVQLGELRQLPAVVGSGAIR